MERLGRDGTGGESEPARVARISEATSGEAPVWSRMSLMPQGILDRPLEPVIALAAGETRWRAMTTGPVAPIPATPEAR